MQLYPDQLSRNSQAVPRLAPNSDRGGDLRCYRVGRWRVGDDAVDAGRERDGFADRTGTVDEPDRPHHFWSGNGRDLHLVKREVPDT